MIVKIPKHGGPDGQGLTEESFLELVKIMQDPNLSQEQKHWSLNLCFSASKEREWNENYRVRLLEIYKNT